MAIHASTARTWLSFAAAGVLVAAPAAAQDRSPLWEGGSLRVGGYFTSSDSSLRIDASGTVSGTEVDFENDFGLESKRTVGSAELDLFPGERHELSLRYFALTRTGSRKIDQSFRIGGVVYPVDVTVSAKLETWQAELAYTYWFLHGERFGAGASLGAVELSAKASATARVPVAGNQIVELSESASAQVPVPLFGVQVRGLVAPPVVATGGVRLLPNVKVGNDRGDLWIGDVGLEWRVLPHLGIGAGYEISRLRVDLNETRWRGKADLTTRGVEGFLRLAW